DYYCQSHDSYQRMFF
nr:immunoglobulin light chain junction region [Macaca mulatta]MOX18704.1 immunoglobulin light chain junction region [Macaca mulatta]MOX20087.1 immunoglobulin light chain junction region [Macaca mulatta]MOX21267.1 immunoglobulin light chain junction region [Macaca mulatta]